MPGYPLVTFLSDYGIDDGFVGVCHAVVLSRAPDARVVDLSHLVPPQDVAHGAALLARLLPQLPRAVHLAVVDPGVGTERRPVAIDAGGGLLVGPDNGLLPDAADAIGGIRRVVVLDRPEWWATDRPSATFHGRDVFAPVAGHLAVGAALDALGSPVDPGTLVRLPRPQVEVAAGRLSAAIGTVDRFGNLALAAGTGDLSAAGLRAGGTVAVQTGGRSSRAVLATTFADVPPGALLAFIDSAGAVALAVRGGSAARTLNVGAGSIVTLAGDRPDDAGDASGGELRPE